MEPILTVRDSFEELVQKFYPLLESASRRGIPIDSEERDSLIIYLNGERKRIYESIQSKVLDDIRGIHPRKKGQAVGYVKTPKEVQKLISIYQSKIALVKANPQNQGKKIATLDEYIAMKTYSPIMKSGEPTKIWGKMRYATFKIVNTITLEEEEVDRWCRVNDFNPNSGKQIIAYMKYKKHKVPVTLDGDETSEAKELERLAIQTGDLFYDEIIEYRQINKMLTNDIPNWEPHAQTGAVHTEFGFLPATGQLNSRNPNVQNANKHKPLGKRFRRIIRARSYRNGRWAGRRRRLVEIDYSGFHALMLGREAQSEKYINISRADAHSWLTSYIVDKPVEYPSVFTAEAYNRFKESLKEIKKAYKTIRDTQAKPTILGVGLGLMPRKMYWMNRPKMDKKSGLMVGIKSEKDAKRYRGILQELLPELFEYQERKKEQAFRQTYLINLWGMIRWFFDVRGEDGEAAIAFDVQGHAHGMLRWVIRRLEESEEFRYEVDRADYIVSAATNVDNVLVDIHSRALDASGSGYRERRDGKVSALDRFNFINTIHDSLVFEPWEDEVELCVREVTRAMETPCKVLADKKVCPEGLVVGVEASVGENWSEWEEKENPGGMKVWKQSMKKVA